MATDPICGMAVDEATAELKLRRDNRTYYFCSGHCLREFAEPARELARLRWRLAVAWPLSAAIAVLTYAHPVSGWPWIAAALATVVQFYPGGPFLAGTIDAARNRSWSMDVLIGVGTTAAYGYSVAALLLPTRLPSAYYFDASALIVTLILTGNYLEHFTRERARSVLRALQELLPATASRVRDGHEETVAVSELAEGSVVRVRPGARFPVDGTLVSGRTTVDESAVTGEGLPVPRGPGDAVVAGSFNLDGLVDVSATRVGPDTFLAHVGSLVAEAETSQVPLQRLADRIATWFVPVVLGLAVLAAFGWGAAGAGFAVVLLVFVSVVITACPCAFGIATPAAIVVGTGRAAEDGILFKGRDALQRASRADIVLTDKTGTLTTGRPHVSEIVPRPGRAADELLGLAASLETGSTHPMATAILTAATARGVTAALAAEVRSEPGVGVEGTVGGHRIELRSPRGVAAEERAWWAEAGAAIEERGGTWSILRADGEVLGVFGFADEVAPGVPESIAQLKADGIETVMVSGDNERAARSVARAVGIGEVHAGLSPQGKLELIRTYQARGRSVAFVGDGINDAPALAAADIGVAIGAGTEVAREAGGVVLLSSRFDRVALALRIGRRTVRKVRGNLVWALGYNAVLLPVAMGALVPLFGIGVFSVLPITGAAAMGLSSTTVVLNSLSLRWTSTR